MVFVFHCLVSKIQLILPSSKDFICTVFTMVIHTGIHRRAACHIGVCNVCSCLSICTFQLVSIIPWIYSQLKQPVYGRIFYFHFFPFICFSLFLKVYFIDYVITVVPIFPPLPPSAHYPPSL